MKAKKVKKKKKGEHRKFRDWERNRRDRLNVSFLELYSTLPDYDPTINRTKIDIITQATSYIKLLNGKVQQLMEKNDYSRFYVDEIAQLKKRITDLTMRCRQLVDILKKTNIPLPTGLPPECLVTALSDHQQKWSDVIKPEMVNDFMKMIKKNKENKKNVEKADKISDNSSMTSNEKKKSKRSKVASKSKKGNIQNSVGLACSSACVSILDNNPTVVTCNTLTITSTDTASNVVTKPLRELNSTVLSKTKNVTLFTTSKLTGTTASLVTTTSSVPIMLSNQLPKASVVTVTKSNLLSAPIMATGIQTFPEVINRNLGLQTLVPGTLILPDGRIVSVPPPPPSAPTVIATQFIMNRPVNPPSAVIVIPNSNVTSVVNNKPVTNNVNNINDKVLQKNIVSNLKKIVPKRPMQYKKDTTKTTFVNKVPIPAVSSFQRNFIMTSKIVKIIKQSPVKNSPNVNGKNNKNTKSNIENKCVKTSPKDIKVKKIVSDKQKLNQNLKTEVSNKEKEQIVNASVTDVLNDQILNESLSVSNIAITSNSTNVNIPFSTCVNENKTKLSSDPENKKQDAIPSPIVKKEQTSVLDNADININSKSKRPFELINDEQSDSQTNKKLKVTSSSTISDIKVSKDVFNNSIVNKECNATFRVVEQNNCESSLLDVNSSSKIANNCEKYSIDALCCKSYNNVNTMVEEIVGDNDKINNQQNDNVNDKNNRCDKLNSSLENFNRNDALNRINRNNNLSDISSVYLTKHVESSSKSNKNSTEFKPNQSQVEKKVATNSSEQINCINNKVDDTAIRFKNITHHGSCAINNEVNISQQIKDIQKKELPRNCPDIPSTSSNDTMVMTSICNFNLTSVSTISTSADLISSNVTCTNNDPISSCINNDSTNMKTFLPKETVYKKPSENIKSAEIISKQNKVVITNDVNPNKNVNTSSGVNNINKIPNNEKMNTSKTEIQNYMCNANQINNLNSNINKTTVCNNFNSAVVPTSNYDLGNLRDQHVLTSVNNCATQETAAVKTIQSNVEVQSLNHKNKDKNTFLPIMNNHNHSTCIDDVRLSIPNSEFSNDLFTSLQVPSGSQHPESLSPTAAFLLAFPLVSTSKTSEMLVDNETSDSQHATPTTILQIGNIEPSNNDIYHNSVVGSSSSMIVENNVASSNNNNNTFNDIKIEQSHQLNRNNPGDTNNRAATKVNDVNKNKDILNHKNANNCQSAIQFQRDHPFNLDNNFIPVPSSSDICYGTNTNKSNNFNRNNMAACNKTNTNNYVSVRSMNKHDGKLQHQSNDCITSVSNIDTRNDIFMPSCTDKKKISGGICSNNMSNHRNDVFDPFMLPNVINNSENQYQDKLFDHRNVQFSSSNAIFPRQKLNINNVPASVNSLGLPSTANCSNVSNKKNNLASVSQTDITPSCSYTQAMSSASSVPLTSQSNSYNLFPNCNELPLSSSTHIPCSSTNNSRQQTSIDVKCPTSSNLSIFPPWSSNNVYTSSFNCNTTTLGMTYTSVTTSMQKSCSTQTTTSKISSQNHQFVNINAVENNNNLKTEKNSLNPLPKFSTNFNLSGTSNNQTFGHQDLFNCQNMPMIEPYKNEKPIKKSKISSTAAQPRPPVNWMTTPDLRPNLHDAPPSIVPDMMFMSSQKDIDFTTANLNNPNNLPPFSISNNVQPFYGLDLPLDVPSQFPEITNSINKSKHHLTSSTSSSVNQQVSSHHYSWSPSKSSIPLLSHIDSHSLMIPSTLPTLVGDLALGTNTGPSTPAADTNIRPFNIPPPVLSLHSSDENNKVNRYNHGKSRHDNITMQHNLQSIQTQKIKDNSNNNQMKEPKDCISNSNARNNSVRNSNTNNHNEFCNNSNKTPHQSHQSTNTTGSFLSVSQLVDQAKSEGRNTTSRRINKSQQQQQPTNNSMNSSNNDNNSKQNSAVVNSNVNLQKRNSTNTNTLSQQNDNKHQSQTQQNVKIINNHSHNNFNHNNNNNNRKLYADNNDRHNYMSSSFSSGVNQNVTGDTMTQWHHNVVNNNDDNKTFPSYKGGNYSAESLIGMSHDTHDYQSTSEKTIPTFTSSSATMHHFGHHHHHHRMNHHTHHGFNHQVQKPFGTVETPMLPVSSTSSTVNSTNGMTSNIINPDFHAVPNNIVQHHSVVGSVDFASNTLAGQNGSSQQVPSYQNCFNFTSSQNTVAPFPSSNHGVPFITDNDYQIGCLDTSYLFPHATPGPSTLSHCSTNVPSTFSTITSSTIPTTCTSLSTPSVSSVSSINLPANRNCQITQSQSVPTMNKLTNSSSLTTNVNNNKSNRKRKDVDNFTLVPPTSLLIPPSSSTSTSICNTTYLHSSHNSYNNSLNSNALPASTRGVNNYHSVLPSTITTTAASSSYSSLNSSVNHSTSTLTNFNLSTIFPEINDKQRNAQGHSSNFLARNIGKQLDIGSGNLPIRNHADYLPSLCPEFNNVIPSQIGPTVNPPLAPHFPTDTFITPSTFSSGQQDQ